MQIFAELLPRLGCANIAVTGSVSSLNSSDIKCDKDKVLVRGKVFLLPGIEFQSDSISGLTVSKKGTIFRVKLKQNEKLPSLIPSNSFNYGGRLKFAPPEIVPEKTYVLTCQCGAEIGRLTPGRVLPLPSGSWQADSLDWYCCVNKLKQAPILKPKTSDFLYNSYCFAVDIVNIEESTVDIDLVDKEVENSDTVTTSVVCCKKCDYEVGSLVRETLHIWCHRVLLNCSGSDKAHHSNKDVKTAEDCFITIINSFVIETISAMPKIMLRNRKGKSVVLWVIDKELTVVKSDDHQNGVKESVMKILLKEGNNVPEKSMELVELSNDIFDTGIKLMESSTENLPESFQVANEFRVSYLPRLK